MAEKTDIIVKFEGREYNVPVGFTAEEFQDSLAATNQRLLNGSVNDRPCCFMAGKI